MKKWVLTNHSTWKSRALIRYVWSAQVTGSLMIDTSTIYGLIIFGLGVLADTINVTVKCHMSKIKDLGNIIDWHYLLAWLVKWCIYVLNGEAIKSVHELLITNLHAHNGAHWLEIIRINEWGLHSFDIS